MRALLGTASHFCEGPHISNGPQLSEHGTYKEVKPRIWPWLSAEIFIWKIFLLFTRTLIAQKVFMTSFCKSHLPEASEAIDFWQSFQSSGVEGHLRGADDTGCIWRFPRVEKPE